jgi:hypothetical protein
MIVAGIVGLGAIGFVAAGGLDKKKRTIKR